MLRRWHYIMNADSTKIHSSSVTFQRFCRLGMVFLLEIERMAWQAFHLLTSLPAYEITTQCLVRFIVALCKHKHEKTNFLFCLIVCFFNKTLSIPFRFENKTFLKHLMLQYNQECAVWKFNYYSICCVYTELEELFVQFSVWCM